MINLNAEYTQYGVPVLTANRIDEIALEVLKYFDEDFVKAPKETPILDVIDSLQKTQRIKFNLTNDLGYENSKKILGQIELSSEIARNTVYIDKLLWDDMPRFKFVVAHEIGHLVLHRKKPLIGYQNKPKISEIKDNEETIFRNGKNSPKSTKDWVEYQANSFAAQFLMPEPTFTLSVAHIQKELGITRNLGKIYLDNQPSNLRDFNLIITKLKNIFKTSKTSIKFRLDNLGLIIQ